MLLRIMKFSSNIVKLLSSQNKVDIKTREALLPLATRKMLVEAAHLASERHLAIGPLAEISLRLPGRKMAINVNDAWFAHIENEDFTIASLQHDRRLIEKEPPSKHTPWHRLIYNNTPADAIILCQPTAALVMARLKHRLHLEFLLDAVQIVGNVGCVEPFESDIKKELMTNRAVLIQGIGMVVWGENLFQVVALAETIEHWCHIQLHKLD